MPRTTAIAGRVGGSDADILIMVLYKVLVMVHFHDGNLFALSNFRGADTQTLTPLFMILHSYIIPIMRRL